MSRRSPTRRPKAINVLPERAVDAYKRVVAGRFRAQALSYRLSTGLPDIESPMAVLFLPVIKARAAGILYTRHDAMKWYTREFLAGNYSFDAPGAEAKD